MNKTFGQFLAEKRKEKNLTQKELANKLFVSEFAVSKWERDKSRPDIELVAEISAILDVSEHELITACVDKSRIKERKQARKWVALTTTYDWCFYIGYSLALFVCFVVNLAVNHTLSWFFVVLCAIALAFSLTSLPKFVKKFKLLILSITPLLMLFLLLLCCNIFSNGDWLLISFTPIVFAFVCVFLPLYVKAYPFPKFIKTHSALFCFLIDVLFLILLLLVCQSVSNTKWVGTVGLPIVGVCLVPALIIIVVARYLKTNKFIKSSICLLASSIFMFLIKPFLITLLNNNLNVEISSFNQINLLYWRGDYINSNTIFLMGLTLVCLSVVFGIIGLLKQYKKK